MLWFVWCIAVACASTISFGTRRGHSGTFGIFFVFGGRIVHRTTTNVLACKEILFTDHIEEMRHIERYISKRRAE